MSCYVDIEAEMSGSDSGAENSCPSIAEFIARDYISSPAIPELGQSQERPEGERIGDQSIALEEQENEEEFADFSRAPKNGFRFQGRWAMLTYPQLGANKPDMRAYRDQLILRGAVAGLLGCELHKDGSFHIHAVVHNPRKWDVGGRHFDLFGKHPNIRLILKGRVEGAEEYCEKRGDTLKWNWDEVPSTSKNYERRKRDKEAWRRDIRGSRLRLDLDAIDAPVGIQRIVLNEPGKKRNLLVVGGANQGKTTWLLHQLRGSRTYEVRSEANPWDQWNGAHVIVFNDCGFWPKKADLTFFTDVGLPFHNGGYLRARFFDKFVEPGFYTTIILCNEDEWNLCPYRYNDWFVERFNIFEMNQEWRCRDVNCECHLILNDL